MGQKRKPTKPESTKVFRKISAAHTRLIGKQRSSKEGPTEALRTHIQWAYIHKLSGRVDPFPLHSREELRKQRNVWGRPNDAWRIALVSIKEIGR